MASYLQLSEAQWQNKLSQLEGLFIPGCRICPRDCNSLRSIENPGWCGGIGKDEVKIYSWNLHLGEEPPITGSNGSGTIFFTGCNLGCIFCQNFPISHLKNGTIYSLEEFSDMMLELQQKGAHNINFVTPTPWTYQIVKAIKLASEKGLEIPIVWNSSGWEKKEVISLLEGIVDIYLPDLKCICEDNSFYFSRVRNYFPFAWESIKEMYRQVGHLKIEGDGIASHGLLIRHLVLPGNLSDSKKVIDLFYQEFGTELYFSLMSQYFPAYQALDDKILKNRISMTEYDKLIEYLEEKGMENVFIQELEI